MRLFFLCMVMLALFDLPLSGQEGDDAATEPNDIPPIVSEMQTPVRVPARPTLQGGTEIWLRLADRVRVKQAKVGDPVNFVLYRDLYYRDWLLAKAGTPVDATIRQVEKAKVLNRGSILRIVFLRLTLLNGQAVPLTGEHNASGGIGTGGRIAGGLLDAASKCNAWGCVLFDIPAVPAALILAVATKGENRNLRINTSAPAYVDGDLPLDLASLPQTEQSSSETGRVTIVGARIGWLLTRYLYCNGIPLARMENHRRLDLELKPGYYRLAMLPSRSVFEFFVTAGAQINLLADLQQVEELNEHEKVAGNKTGGQLLQRSRPVDKKNSYTLDCPPLAEEIVQQ